MAEGGIAAAVGSAVAVGRPQAQRIRQAMAQAVLDVFARAAAEGRDPTDDELRDAQRHAVHTADV